MNKPTISNTNPSLKLGWVDFGNNKDGGAFPQCNIIVVIMFIKTTTPSLRTTTISNCCNKKEKGVMVGLHEGRVKRIHLLAIVFVLVYVVVHKSNNINYVPTTKKNVKGKLGVAMARVKFHHHEMLELFEPLLKLGGSSRLINSCGLPSSLKFNLI
jgi:hypothetical protein